MGADLGARFVRKSSGAGQHHTVGIVIDHQGGRADDAGADNCLRKIDNSGRGEAIAEEEGVEAIKTTELVECDLAVRDKKLLVSPFRSKSFVLQVSTY